MSWKQHCELCHCWQHGNCFGYFEDEDLPKYYVCESCRSPGNASRAKFWEWRIPGYYKTGQLPLFPGGPATDLFSEGVRSKCNEVKKWIMNTLDCIDNCNLKLRIAQKKPDHTKLYQWQYPSENPLRQKQIRDFRKTYKPWLYRRAKALQNVDENLKKNVKKAYLKNLYWKKFQILVEDFKWGIRSFDPKFLIILNKLSIYQRWKVRNSMEERRRLNFVDKETVHTNPFAIWARKHRQRQQWEIKMRKHANILEKELNIEELLITSEKLLASAATFRGGDNKVTGNMGVINAKRTEINDLKSNSDGEDFTNLNKFDKIRRTSAKFYCTTEFTFAFCSKCRQSAGKCWDWSEFADNSDEFFEKKFISKKIVKSEKLNDVYQPKTLKCMCEKVITDLKVEKRKISSFSGVEATLLDSYDSHFHNFDTSKDESKYHSDEFNCSDTTESIDCDDSFQDRDSTSNVEEEECIRCYLVSVSLSKDLSFPSYGTGLSGLCNAYKLELEKLSVVSHRDLLTFLNLPEATRQTMWDSIENSLPYIPITPKRYPTIRKKERKSVIRIIRHYTAELKRYWTRMFNIRLKGVDLMMQKQTWADELVRIYSEIHLILEDMRKVVDDSAQVDKLGDILLRKIDILRSICGTPDYSPLENSTPRTEISSKLSSLKRNSVVPLNSKSKTLREVTSRNVTDKQFLSCEDFATISKVYNQSDSPLLSADDSEIVFNPEISIMELLDSCITKVEKETISEVNLLSEKPTNVIESKNYSNQITTDHYNKNKTSTAVIKSLPCKSVSCSVEKSNHSELSVSETILFVRKQPESEGCSINELPSSSALNEEEALASSQVTCLTKLSGSINAIDTLRLGQSSSDPLHELTDNSTFDGFDVSDSADDINLKLFSDSLALEPLRGSHLKRTIVPKIRAPFIRKLTAESCRENLLQNILRQQELIDGHLDKLEDKVCELERKYTKRNVDPMSTSKFVKAVQAMVFYNKKLTFLKRNAITMCGGNDFSCSAQRLVSDIKMERSTITEDCNSRIDEATTYIDGCINAYQNSNRKPSYSVSKYKLGFFVKEMKERRTNVLTYNPQKHSLNKFSRRNNFPRSSLKSSVSKLTTTSHAQNAAVKQENRKLIITDSSSMELDYASDFVEEEIGDQKDSDCTQGDD